MAKQCRDCSNGQCVGEIYNVSFTTKKGVSRTGDYSVDSPADYIDEEYWVLTKAGAIEGLAVATLSFTGDTFRYLVLIVNGAEIPLFTIVNGSFLPTNNAPFPDASRGYRRRYLGNRLTEEFTIDNIALVSKDGDTSPNSNIKCKCEDSDYSIPCAKCPNGLLCIPKSKYSDLCNRL